MVSVHRSLTGLSHKRGSDRGVVAIHRSGRHRVGFSRQVVTGGVVSRVPH